ncbi:MAG: hypothetical protein ACPGVI_05270 [Crocinitomicaceae bacterium]
MKYFYYIFFILLITSCGSVKKLEVNEIRTVYVEYNPVEAVNFGSEIEAKIIAMMHDGSEIDITNNRKLTITSEDIIKNGLTKKFKIVKRPTSFNDNTANIHLTIRDKEDTYQRTDSIRMNFKGDLYIDARGEDGFPGESQKNKSSRLLLRDGKHGDHGTHATNGQNADEYVSNIWQEAGMTFIYMRNTRTGMVWRYKTLGQGTITFDLTGGNGGNGGDGGDGGNGRDGRLSDGKYTRPGNGGDGGNGGNSGSGGNGGTVHVMIHPNNSVIETKLVYVTDGGIRGNSGKAGKGGRPGTPVNGQAAGRSGRPGYTGQSGRNGIDGQVQPLNFQEFEFNQFK